MSTAVVMNEIHAAQTANKVLNQGYKEKGKAELAELLEGLKYVPDWRERLANALFISEQKLNNLVNGVVRTPDLVEQFKVIAGDMIDERLTELGWDLAIVICQALREPTKSMRMQSRKRRYVDLRCVYCLMAAEHLPLLTDQRIATVTGMERSMVSFQKKRGYTYLETKEDEFTEKHTKAAAAVAEWAKHTIKLEA